MKYFVISDIHSFATEMKWVLRQAGFNKKNKNHTLIVCGDIFDRGNETLEVYKYLKSIPKKSCILVKGNHESLYFDL
jgi:serine/threonine protein phosphatase 1